jgi:hypothetical protein
VIGLAFCKVAKGEAAAAYDIPDTSEWETPEDLAELVLLLNPEVSDHKVLSRVVFTGDPDLATAADQRDQNGLWRQRCWDFVRVLYEYAELKSEGTFVGNVHGYLGSGDHNGFKVPIARHASTESKQTIDQWGNERIFPVPTSVDPSGRSAMYAHFKAGTENTYAPRLYYLDDVDNTGKVYIGYIGRHLTNLKTKNA